MAHMAPVMGQFTQIAFDYICLPVQDPKRRHELDRKTVKELICALCNTRQPVSQHCQHCHVAFGTYTCMDCIFFDDTDKKQFHCTDCGICRVGGRAKFFHCSMCGCCYDKKLQVRQRCCSNAAPECVLYSAILMPSSLYYFHDICKWMYALVADCF